MKFSVLKIMETNTDFGVVVKKHLDHNAHYPYVVNVIDKVHQEIVEMRAFESETLANKKAKEWQKAYSTS